MKKTINLGLIGRGNTQMARLGMKSFGWIKKGSLRPKQKSKVRLF
jgi:hypothetical protein